MQSETFPFSKAATTFYFDAPFAALEDLAEKNTAVLLVDENVLKAHAAIFYGWRCIVVPSGEAYKVQATVDRIIAELISLGADRATTLVGVGGGVVTDITGYVASVFLRGVRFGFVPTTVLAMVDAAIGGKNGIDVGVYKNMVGTITQPQFLLYSMGFLKTLPEREWRNGFAEIIKHGAIKDKALFDELAAHNLNFYKENNAAMQALVQHNVRLKASVVQTDEFETGERRLLNFGHTLAHALEKNYNLMHGEAVAIGMMFAAKLSAAVWGFEKVEALQNITTAYGLPTAIDYDKNVVFDVLQRDKKRAGEQVHFVLLHDIGNAAVEKISLTRLKTEL